MFRRCIAKKMFNLVFYRPTTLDNATSHHCSALTSRFRFADGLVNLGLNVLILVLIGFVAFSIATSIGSVIENAGDDERGFSLRDMDVVGTIERLHKLYESFAATSA